MLLRETMDTPRSCLKIDADTFRSHFNLRPFLFSHNLSRHPLFQLPRLVKLAEVLRRSDVDYTAGGSPVSRPNRQDAPHPGLTAEETIHNTAEICSWMELKRAEQCPDFKRLLDACLDEIAPLSEPIEPGMCEREAAVFVSSPGSVTPYHMDHEINFLLQLRGAQTVSVFNADDAAVLPTEDMAPQQSQVHLDVTFPLLTTHKNSRFVSPGIAFCSSNIVGMPRSAAKS